MTYSINEPPRAYARGIFFCSLREFMLNFIPALTSGVLRTQNRSLIIIPILIVVLLFSLPKPAYAHVLQSNGSVGAVLHIDPEDDPIVGQQAGFFFEFKDKEGKFTPQNCDCTFSIVDNSGEVYAQALFQDNTNPSLKSAGLFFTFQKKGVYQIVVTGKPYIANAFQPFTLTYDIRVERIAKQASTKQNGQASQQRGWISGHIIHLVAACIVLFFVLFNIVKQQMSKKIKR